MRTDDLARVLDRAPVLLGAGGDLARVGDQAGGVAAIGAVEFLERVEIRQLGAVEDDVIAAPDLADAVERETDGVVDGQAEVENRQRHDEAVDERRREQVLRPAGEQPADEAGFEPPVRLPHRLFELDLFALDAVAHLRLLRV